MFENILTSSCCFKEPDSIFTFSTLRLLLGAVKCISEQDKGNLGKECQHSYHILGMTRPRKMRIYMMVLFITKSLI